MICYFCITNCIYQKKVRLFANSNLIPIFVADFEFNKARKLL
jgi:hypothetical protein